MEDLLDNIEKGDEIWHNICKKDVIRNFKGISKNPNK